MNTSFQDVPTIEQLYEDYHDLISRCIARLIPNHEDVEDLTQETFLRAMRALPTLKHTDNLGGWLCTIAMNSARDVLRRRAHIPMSSLDDLHQYHSPDPDLQEASVTRACIEQAVARLIPTHQQIWRARYQHDCTHRDLMALTGRSPQQVYKLVRSANNAFRRSYRLEVES